MSTFILMNIYATIQINDKDKLLNGAQIFL